MDYLLSRHPIFRPKMDVAGYEVRTRGIGAKLPELPDAERSMLSALSDTGLEQLVGSHSCYVNVTPEGLAEGLWRKIPVNKLVLGYFNDFAPGDAVTQELLKIVGSGSHIA